MPLTQLPLTQLASVVHEVWHAPLLHASGLQLVIGPATHVPAPLQVDAAMATTPSPHTGTVLLLTHARIGAGV